MQEKQDLLQEYDALEDAIESAAVDEYWELADWLVENVPSEGRGGDRHSDDFKLTRVSLKDLAARGRRSADWLGRMRRVAETTASDREDGVSVRTYEKALKNSGWVLAEANEAIRLQGPRLRDHEGPMESVEAIQKQLGKRSVAERAAVVSDLVRNDPAVRRAVAQDPTTRRSLGQAIANQELSDQIESNEQGVREHGPAWLRYPASAREKLSAARRLAQQAHADILAAHRNGQLEDEEELRRTRASAEMTVTAFEYVVEATNGTDMDSMLQELLA